MRHEIYISRLKDKYDFKYKIETIELSFLFNNRFLTFTISITHY